jgi:hypothetical protein
LFGTVQEPGANADSKSGEDDGSEDSKADHRDA